MKTETRKEFAYSNETGGAVLTVYTVFPGIQVVYNAVHMNRFDLSQVTRNGNFIEIQHCMEGRIEQEFENTFFYLMPGDLSIAKREQMVREYQFPTQHYHGILITIDIDVAPKCFSAFMEDVKVQPMEVANRLCGDRKCVVLRNHPTVEHIFSEIYTIKEENRLGYLKIKILELLFVLNLIEPTENASEEIALPKKQVQLAKEVADYLSKQMGRHVTIAEIARRFGVSETYLKTSFKSVYGVPVCSYTRMQKMQTAARALVRSDRSVVDIAAEFGYNNESKFSAAFRRIMGQSPREYRNEYSRVTIL